ncbi:MAG: ATP-binding protein [Alphaproteobacteria bacterium]|jgi:predicted AAA+ superfamily ATPase|nr:ATP-binding protein [Alphaproteobacteria bacterium]
MNITKEELASVLGHFNPWWRGESVVDLPTWRRAAYEELSLWIQNPPVPRAILLSGARQVGKTTLLLQVITELLKQGTDPANILYATLDHPILKLAGIKKVLETWREREPKKDGLEYLFIDEAQFIPEWGTWVKHQVDFERQRRIIFTGSAMPLIGDAQESGVGRWHTIKLTTLSFYEYIQLKKIKLNPLPDVNSLKELFNWGESDFYRTAEQAVPYVGHFHDYLIRGGFPQTALVETVNQAQKLLREDIIDKALKRDMTALFGVRRVLDLEQLFLYLCMHDGGLLDMAALCSNLQIKRGTAQNFLELLEATHLIYRLPPYGYGKEILRARYKVYLADAAIAPAVLLKGKSIIEDPLALSVATEAAVFKHLFSRYYSQNIKFTYWRGKKDHEVDLVAEIDNQMVPFEIKYKSDTPTGRDIKGLMELCQEKNIQRGYVVTKSIVNFGQIPNASGTKAKIMHLPAALLCYWMGKSEILQHKQSDEE